MKTKSSALAISLIMAAFLLILPGTAFAAKKQSVYVVSKIVRKVNGYQFGTYSTPDSTAKAYTTTYSYLSNGLLKQLKAKNSLTLKYQYDSKNRIKTYSWNGSNYTGFKYDKKGRVKEDPAFGKFTYDSKGKIKKTNIANGELIYTYTYSNGVIKKMVMDAAGYKTICKYTYDSKKNLTGKQSSDKYTLYDIAYKNTYKSGRLTKRVATETIRYEDPEHPAENSTTTFVITYKKISVPSNLVSRVKAQQAWIVQGGTEYNDYNVPLTAAY